MIRHRRPRTFAGVSRAALVEDLAFECKMADQTFPSIHRRRLGNIVRDRCARPRAKREPSKRYPATDLAPRCWRHGVIASGWRWRQPDLVRPCLCSPRCRTKCGDLVRQYKICPNQLLKISLETSVISVSLSTYQFQSGIHRPSVLLASLVTPLAARLGAISAFLLVGRR